MAEVKSGLLAAVILGAFIGLLLVIVRYGINKIIDATAVGLYYINIYTILDAAYALFFILAGLFCGYIVAARASGVMPIKRVYRDAAISGAVAGLIVWPGIMIIYYSHLVFEMPNFMLYGAYDLVKLVMLSLAGASVYAAFAGPRRTVIHRWLAGAGVGIVGAIGVTWSVFVLWFVDEIFNVLPRNSLFGSLFTEFTFDVCMLIIGVLAGMATAALIRRSAWSPASYVFPLALAGLIAGAIGYGMYYFFFEVFMNAIFMPEVISDQVPYILEEITFGAITLAMMAIAGGAIYALYRNEARLLSARPPELERRP